MQVQNISEETLNDLATRIADKVCYRIGNAFIQTGQTLMVVGIGLMIFGHFAGKKRKNFCPWAT